MYHTLIVNITDQKTDCTGNIRMQIHNELITGRILFQSMNTLYDHGKQPEAYDIYVDCIFSK